jgi:hypothetical protein
MYHAFQVPCNESPCHHSGYDCHVIYEIKSWESQTDHTFKMACGESAWHPVVCDSIAQFTMPLFVDGERFSNKEDTNHKAAIP